MKNQLFVLMLIFSISICLGQEKASNFTGRNQDQPHDPRSDQMNFVPNEVLIKFKDAVTVTQGSRVKAAGVNSVDKVLQNYGVSALEKLFPNVQKPTRSRMMKSPQGKDMNIPRLDNIYRISIPEPKSTNTQLTNIFQVIDELKALPEVEYAEPNYIYSVDAMNPVGPILTPDDVKKMQPNQRISSTAVTPNDPFYSQQWYIPAVKADQVWEQTTGDSTQVIAILDTGVDWNHPDLKNKIWTNKAEIPGNGIDDDGNGLIDDIRGWDYINNDNNPMDDNSHGTHVAGIAAAETNNGIGIAGVNWKAKIMPIKVFQSSGRGDAATITKGIIYASMHGATVINMSFGSYARSLAMEDVLANAYATTLLVAAAGNDGMDIGPCQGCSPNYPAAFSYVLGVASPDGSFSNYDSDGPTFSRYNELFNYELKSPGTNIISTIPNGNYRIFQGTSMAAPIVSAALSLYRKLIPYDTETNEFMWVKLIQSTEQYLDIYKALTFVPKPEVVFLNNALIDTIGNDDKDGRVDAGERIQLWFRARNTGGQVDSVYWKIRLAEFEDPTTCNIIKPTSYLGSISPYATRTSENDPMIFDISSNVAHDRDITFDLLSWFKGSNDTIVQKYVFTVENGEQLSGVLDGVKTLYPNRLYLVNNSYKVGTNGTLIIKPGAKIIFYKGKSIPVNGRLIADGKPDSLINFIGQETVYNGGSGSPIFVFGNDIVNNNRFSYCNFENLNSPLAASSNRASVFNCIFDNVNIIGVIDSLVNCNYVSNEAGVLSGSYAPTYLYKNNFIGRSTSKSPYFSTLDYAFYRSQGISMKYNNFINYGVSYPGYIENSNSTDQNSWISEFSKPPAPNTGWVGNGIHYINGSYINIKFFTESSADFQMMQYQYWGTNDSKKMEAFAFDFMKEATRPQAVFQPFLNAPPDSCHAVVWKVLVNGKDAQDEVVEPVGVGKQRFDVYFNRPMDKTIAPQVSFGVRYPFSSNAVNEDGDWSEDGQIYTVYKTVKLTSGDGINRIRVVGAKGLNDWEIPTEDMRFDFLISAASSSSLEFMATPGLGKVALEWNNAKLEDGLGFNMYRMEQINDSTLSQPVLINSSLILDTLYSDFAVTPNKKYFYYYKILRTNMAETDSSKVVSAIPFTASKGDANGDLNVNVLDVTTIVAYLLNNNPQPFIAEAADVNSDNNINVLDIVGVVNLVLNGSQKAPSSVIPETKLYMQNDTLYADTNVAIGAIQMDIKGMSGMEDVQILNALEGFESGNSLSGDTLRLIFYSMTGKNIQSGEGIPLLKLKTGSKIVSTVFGKANGSPINVNFILSRIGDINENMNQSIAELGQNYPNPVNGQTIIPIRIYESVDEIVLRVLNLMGQEVDVIRMTNPLKGENLIHWNARQNKGLFVYKLEIRQGAAKSVCPAMKMMVQ